MKKTLIISLSFLVLTVACGESEKDKKIAELEKTNTNQDISELCNIFAGIRKATDKSGGNLDSAEDWEKRIVWTEKILQAAPQDYKEEAKVYLQLVKDREKLLAAYNYV